MSSDKNMEWIIFDAMGVIFEIGDDLNELLVPFIQKKCAGISREEIDRYYTSASLGEMTSEHFWEKVGLGDSYPAIDTEYLSSCPVIDPLFISTVERLRSKYKFGLLSNDLSTWSKYLRRSFALDDLFDVVIISADVGLRKPDSKIFALLLDQLPVPASSCIYIDDRNKNLKMASSLGFSTVRFVREGDIINFKPDREITSFNELSAVIESLSCNR